MELITYLTQRLKDQVPALVAEYRGDKAASDLGAIEVAVKHLVQEVGNDIVRQVREAQEPRYPAEGGYVPAAEQRCVINGGAPGWS